MKNDTTLVRMRSGDHLGDAKMSKRAPHSVEFNFLTNCDRQKRFSQNERKRADLQNVESDFLIFAPGLSYDLSKLSDDLTPFFFDFERPKLSPWAKIKKSEAIFCSHEHDEQVCQVS